MVGTNWKLPNPLGDVFCIPYYYLIIPMVTTFFVRFLFTCLLNYRWHLRSYGRIRDEEKKNFHSILGHNYRKMLSNIRFDDDDVDVDSVLNHSHERKHKSTDKKVVPPIATVDDTLNTALNTDGNLDGYDTPGTDSGAKRPLQLVIHQRNDWSMDSITLTDTSCRAESNIEMTQISIQPRLNDIKHDFIPSTIIDEILSFVPMLSNEEKQQMLVSEEEKRLKHPKRLFNERIARLCDIPLGIYAFARLASIIGCIAVITSLYYDWGRGLKAVGKHFSAIGFAALYMPSLKMNGLLMYSMDVGDLKLRKPYQQNVISKRVESLLYWGCVLDIILAVITSIVCSQFWMTATFVYPMIPAWFILQCIIWYKYVFNPFDAAVPTHTNKWIRRYGVGISEWAQCFLHSTQLIIFCSLVGVSGSSILWNKNWAKAFVYTFSGEYCNDAMTSDTPYDWRVYFLIVSWLIY